MNNIMNISTADLAVITSNEKTSQNGNVTRVNTNIATITDAINTATKCKDKVDYAIAVMVNALSKIPDEAYKSLDLHYSAKKDGKEVDVFVNNYSKYCYYAFGYSQSHCSKLARVAEKFLSISDTDNFLKLSTTNSDQYAIDKNSNVKLEIVADFNSVSGLCDRYGYPFNISQLAEMLTYTNEQIVWAIENGDIDSTSAAQSGIRDTLKKLYKTTTDSNSDSNSDSTTDSTTDTDDNSVTYVVQNNDTSRLSSILSILETIENEKFKETKFVMDFIKTVNVTIANNK